MWNRLAIATFVPLYLFQILPIYYFIPLAFETFIVRILYGKMNIEIMANCILTWFFYFIIYLSFAKIYVQWSFTTLFLNYFLFAAVVETVFLILTEVCSDTLLPPFLFSLFWIVLELIIWRAALHVLRNFVLISGLIPAFLFLIPALALWLYSWWSECYITAQTGSHKSSFATWEHL